MSSKCPVCGHSDSAPHVKTKDIGLTSRVIGSSRTEVSVGLVLRCKSCGHGYRKGSFCDAELGALYEHMEVSCYEAEEAFRVATARRHLNLIRTMKRVEEGHRLLDVGCASGLFLGEARKRGWHVTGVEPNRKLAAKAEERLGTGVVRCATLAGAQLEPESFDVITAWDVVEHLANPAVFLQDCARLLKPDGVLWLKAPDIGSVQARLMGARWPVYLPEHLGYFTRKSLLLCASTAGLRILRLTRGSVTFSVGYVLFRLTQHKVPLSGAMQVIMKRTGLDKMPISLRLGEVYACLVLDRGRGKKSPVHIPERSAS